MSAGSAKVSRRCGVAKSRPGQIDRPRISHPHIAYTYIGRISGDHPEWGEDKIAEELAAEFGSEHSRSTIRRYMAPRKPRGGQIWRTFVRNHAKELWACDCLTQYTALFTIAYVFIIMRHAANRICQRHDQLRTSLGEAAGPQGDGFG